MTTESAIIFFISRSLYLSLSLFLPRDFIARGKKKFKIEIKNREKKTLKSTNNEIIFQKTKMKIKNQKIQSIGNELYSPRN